VRYAQAFAIAAAAAWLTHAFIVPLERPYFFAAFPAVVLAALLGGTGPGVFCVAAYTAAAAAANLGETFGVKQRETAGGILGRTRHFCRSANLSLAPGFSRVKLAAVTGNGFNRFPVRSEAKPLKRLCRVAPTSTGLKPGANERSQKPVSPHASFRN
jgi:hypothetical protein